jgi:GT2 family glycosyltransferase
MDRSAKKSRSLTAGERGAKKQRRPVVSVCIVNWNCRALLKRCLRSLHCGQQVRLEVIVVDNGSTDGAADMVERLFPRVRLLRNARNESFSRANNQAARLALGRYLFFLNNDTELPPGTLRRLVGYARTHPEVGIIGPCLKQPSGRAQISCRLRPSIPALLHRTALLRWTGLFRRAYRRYRFRLADRTTVQPVEVMMGAALLVPRRVFRECGPWDEDYTFGGEDIDLCTRVGRRYRVVYHPGIDVIHHGRASSRQQIGYAHTHTVVGITRFLRKSGTSSWALLCYKLALTLDAPLQWLRHAGQFLWRRLRGDTIRAEKSRLVLRAVGHFLTRGLFAFWRV